MPTATDKSFDATLADVADVEGWMTDAQARRLWDSARPRGARWPDRGDRKLPRTVDDRARGAPLPTDVEVVAIDPHLGTDRGPQEIVTTAEHGDSDHDLFLANLDAAGVQDRVRHVRKLSSAALADVADPIDTPLHRRRPPLRSGACRSARLGCARRARRHAAGARHVQLRRRDRGHRDRAPRRARWASSTSGDREPWRSTGGASSTRTHGSPTPVANWRSSPTSCATSRSRS